LAEAGVGTLIHYPVAPHHQEAFSGMAGLSLPISERIHAEVLSLPIGPQLAESEQLRAIEALLTVSARIASMEPIA